VSGRALGRVAAPCLAVLLAGCGLPLADGVQRPGAVPAEQRLSEPINVLPPGPQPGASPEAVVFGFLAAQSSARDEHGIARQFLAPAQARSWDDDAGVTVYDPGTVTPQTEQDEDEVVVSLRLDVVGGVQRDGSADVRPATEVVQRYRLVQEPDEQWRLVQVPSGLSLSSAARDRAYDALSVYFLAPQVLGSGRHLVADLLQLPARDERAAVLVDRLLAGPSGGLDDSVQTAVPAGTRLVSPVRTTAQGEVTVDLSGEVAALSDAARQELSAQLVWTLRQVPGFARLRLLVEGEVLPVPGVASPQPQSSWPGFNPSGPSEHPGGLALVRGQLRDLDRAREQSPAVLEERSDVVDVAVDPRSSALAVLTERGGQRTVETGPLTGGLTAGLTSPGLLSPTWGSGELGLWLLRSGDAPAVLLLPADGGATVQVAVQGLPALDDDALLRVSRDGARVALVADGVLYVGRVVLGQAQPRVVDLRRLATDVRDVAWETGTTLAVLVADTEAPLLPLLRLSVDGTSAVTGALLGVGEGDPVALAAYGEQPLLVQTRLRGRSTVYAGDGTRGFQVLLRHASRPAYPR